MISPERDTPERPAPDAPHGAPLFVRGRATFLHLSLAVAAIVLLGWVGRVQLVNADHWRARADEQHMRVAELPAPRGRITDAEGEPLASSQEKLRVTLAPNQVKRGPKVDHRPQLIAELRALDVPQSYIDKALDSTRTWLELPRHYLPSEVANLRRLSGVRPEWVMERSLEGTAGLRRLVGTVDRFDTARSGLELAFDSLLAGTRGRRHALKDARGRLWDSPVGTRVNAVPGHTIALTINSRLQEIVERELIAGVRKTRALAGDVVVLDVRTGKILAMAGADGPRIASNVTPLTMAYEPGSVLKPFFVARLLDAGRVTPGEQINTENGEWMFAGNRVTDTHKAPYLSVFDVVRWSSNVGTVKLVTERLTPGEEYELLRDYGFGVMAGVPYPSQARGEVPPPSRWRARSPAQLAIGYEMTVTPLQLAVAYAAIANGGELLEPAVVEAITKPSGEVVYAHERRVLRRVATPASAALVRDMLKAVVDSGTGTEAGLAAFEVGGKSGTARRAVEGRYNVNVNYNGTFAAIFPMSDPQVVIVVRLMDPSGDYYGGLVAGPVVREILKAASTAPDAGLDRDVLARTARPAAYAVADSVTRAAALAAQRTSRRGAAATPTGARSDDTRRTGAGSTQPADVGPANGASVVPAMNVAPSRAGQVVVQVPFVPPTPVGDVVSPRPVPSVVGLSARGAARVLHDAGFRVRPVAGTSGRTRPVAGTMLTHGAVVRLELGGTDARGNGSERTP